MKGCRHNFFLQHLNFLHGKFQDCGTSPSNFIWLKEAIFSHFALEKISCLQNIGTFLPFQRGIICFVQKWAQHKCWLLNIFLLLNFHCWIYSAIFVSRRGGKKFKLGLKLSKASDATMFDSRRENEIQISDWKL